MKRILITGITGFLGSSLVAYFKENEQIKLYGHSRDIEDAKLKFQNQDIEFLSEITTEVLDQCEIDIILHLAGIAHDLSGKYKEEDYFIVNVGKTKMLYDQFLNSTCTTFIFISSIKAVIDHTDDVIQEDMTANPFSPYGNSKFKAEKILEENQLEGKALYILRPCMVHGPGNKGNLNLLYQFVRRGIPYPLTVYENKRSFLSVENFCFVIENIVNGVLKTGTYNLADDQALSTTELVKLIGQGIGRRVVLWRIPRSIIAVLATIGTWIHAPFNSITLSKLTENMVVSNKKLLLNLGKQLPVSAKEGLLKTIKSFDG